MSSRLELPPAAGPVPWPPRRGGLAAPRAPYTVHDTPEVVARVEADLALIAAEVRRADPRLRALVLTGGFARGEGSMSHGAPQNDYDLVALRGLGPPREPYPRVRARLEARLGLHVDLQPVWAGRLPWVGATVFWYETALRGRAVWGDAALLRRIPLRDPRQLEAGEGLRLLANRAAGLLLAEGSDDARLLRIQASKGFLAALDAHLFARGRFAPSQRERWTLAEGLRAAGELPELDARADWHAWAFRFKVAPDAAEAVDPRAAWEAAADAILDALPPALRAAGAADVHAYARRDGPADHATWLLRSKAIAGARRLVADPTGKVRALTFALLAERRGRAAGAGSGAAWAALLKARPQGPAAEAAALDTLRQATLQ